MRHLHKSCIRLLKTTGGLPNRSFLVQILLFAIMQDRWVWVWQTCPTLSVCSWWIIKFSITTLQVTYQANHFLDKNKDYVVAEHQDLLHGSKCPFVAGLFPSLPEESSKASKFSSIGSRFKVIFLTYWIIIIIRWKSIVYLHLANYLNKFSYNFKF